MSDHTNVTWRLLWLHLLLQQTHRQHSARHKVLADSPDYSVPGDIPMICADMIVHVSLNSSTLKHQLANLHQLSPLYHRRYHRLRVIMSPQGCGHPGRGWGVNAGGEGSVSVCLLLYPSLGLSNVIPASSLSIILLLHNAYLHVRPFASLSSVTQDGILPCMDMSLNGRFNRYINNSYSQTMWNIFCTIQIFYGFRRKVSIAFFLWRVWWKTDCCWEEHTVRAHEVSLWL